MSKNLDNNALIELNSVGISLGGIAKRLNCHHTTVTSRLTALGVPLADTRRAFMEDIYESLTEKQQKWLIDQLGPNHSVKDYIKSLILKQYIEKNP